LSAFSNPSIHVVGTLVVVGLRLDGLNFKLNTLVVERKKKSKSTLQFGPANFFLTAIDVPTFVGDC